MADDQSTTKSFFTTLPGIITAIAGLITAVGGFLLILSKTGCLNAKEVTSETTTEQHAGIDDNLAKPPVGPPAKNSSISYSPASIKHVTRNIVYNIGSAEQTILPGGEVVVSINLKCINKSPYEFHFYSNNLRVKLGVDSYAVDPYSPSGDYQSVPANSFKNLSYNFKLPASTKQFKLDFYDENTQVGTASFLLKE